MVKTVYVTGAKNGYGYGYIFHSLAEKKKKDWLWVHFDVPCFNIVDINTCVALHYYQTI